MNPSSGNDDRIDKQDKIICNTCNNTKRNDEMGIKVNGGLYKQFIECREKRI